MAFDKAGNSEDLDNEKLQLICKAYKKELLSNQRVVDGINLMDYSKLKILCKYNNKLSGKSIKQFLSKKSSVDNANDLDDDAFEDILNENNLEVLENQDELESSDSEENYRNYDSSDDEGNEEDYGYYDNFDYKEDDDEMAMSSKSQSDREEDKVEEDILKLQEDPEIAENLSFIDDKTLKVIYKKFSSEEIIEILKDPVVVVNIINYNNKELEHVFNICVSLTTQDTIKVLSITPKKLRLICNNKEFSFSDARTLLENQEIVEHLSFIDDQTFKVICNSKYNGKPTSINNKIIRLLEKKEIVKNICSIGYEKHELLMLNNDKKNGFLLSDIIGLLKNRKVVENIISFNIEKFRLIFRSGKLKSLGIVDITELLENQEIVDCINSIAPEKLELIFNNGNFSFENIIKTLKDQKIVDCINSIAPEKLKLIFTKFSSQDIIKVLEDQDVVKGINSVTTKELKAITDNVTGKVFVSIFKNFEPSVSQL